jgi:hypothetical protein
MQPRMILQPGTKNVTAPVAIPRTAMTRDCKRTKRAAHPAERPGQHR